MSTLIPGTAPLSLINSGILFPPEPFCFIVSSYKITPPMQSFIDDEEKSVSLNNNLLSGLDSTFTDDSLFVIVTVLSSAASIPFPLDKIFFAILCNSDI